MSDAVSRLSVARRVFAVLVIDTGRGARPLLRLMLFDAVFALLDGFVVVKRGGMHIFVRDGIGSLSYEQHRCMGRVCAPYLHALLVLELCEVSRVRNVETEAEEGKSIAALPDGATFSWWSIGLLSSSRATASANSSAVLGSSPMLSHVLDQFLRTAHSAVPSME